MDRINKSVVGLAGTPGQGNFFEVVLHLEAGTIGQSQYRCHPCAIANHIGKSLVSHLTGLPADQAIRHLPNWYQQIKESIPQPKMRVLGLALEALNKALAKAQEQILPNGHAQSDEQEKNKGQGGFLESSNG